MNLLRFRLCQCGVKLLAYGFEAENMPETTKTITVMFVSF